MTKSCPKCGDPNSLDYDPSSKKWRCVWIDCDYEEPNQDKDPKSFVIIDGLTYEIDIPIDIECPTSSLCNDCVWNQPYFSNRKICIFPKVLYGNLDAYNEYLLGNIGIKELIEKYGK